MKILFVCTANSCRSQMAEAWARHLFPAGWSAASAGLLTHPIHARTRTIMAEAGVAMDGQHSKSIDTLDLDGFDLVVTLSREAGRFLPALADPAHHRPCPMADPTEARGTPAEIRAAYRAGREHLRELVSGLVTEFTQP
ncbi:MAG: arsenate reductase ArsC [bacterium]|nr:arsenate reductase ArsC [bacterium]